MFEEFVLKDLEEKMVDSGAGLREYLFLKKQSVTDFAKEIKFSRPHLSAVMNGRRMPSRGLREIIKNKIKEFRLETFDR